MSERIERALLSVSDKTGLVELARGLVEAGITILSTGGTARALREAGIAVTDVAEHTGSPEILDGRVKTLHPKIHGGILARRDDPEHRRQLVENGIGTIGLVCVNLYPFADVTAGECTEEEAIENIDIGGPSMVRSAAKNAADVAVVVDPSDYATVLDEIRRTGRVSSEVRRRLAVKAFRATAAYDAMIADWLARDEASGFGETLHQQWHLVRRLRYGENPHQSAALYREPRVAGPSVATARVLAGKDLSYNNIVDADAALQLVMDFDETVCAVLKHTNPCGVAVAETAAEAFRKARRCDPVSIFGGIVALNREIDRETAEAMRDVFLEVVLAPSFAEDALAVFASSPKLRNARLLVVDPREAGGRGALDFKRVLGGLLVQTRDLAARASATAVGSPAAAASARSPERAEHHEAQPPARGAHASPAVRVATKRAPTPAEVRALELAWRVAKHVKSNAIVLAREDMIVGVGAGQMSRVDAARLAVARAREHGLETKGAVVASDAFFPFRDGLDVCADSGATACIQPGGSVRDDEIVAAADEHGMAMLMTGVRHFRH